MQVFLDSSFLLLLFFIFVFSLLVAYLYTERERKNSTEEYLSEQRNEGEPRNIFVLFYLCITWLCFIFFLPMLLSIPLAKQLVSNSNESFLMILKILPAPTTLLLLLLFGSKRQFLSWVNNLDWFNKNKEQ